MEWRRHPRQFHRMFHKGAVVNYQPLQLEHAQHLLRRLVDDPGHFVSHIRHFFGATIMRIAYGLEVADEDDRYISLVEKCVNVFIQITVPVRYLVEALHVLRHLAFVVSGREVQAGCSRMKKAIKAMRDVPFHTAKNKIDSGDFSRSVVSRMLGKSSLWDTRDHSDREELCCNISAIAYLSTEPA
ncbi:hypothetical protein LXA43DRAFT_1097070 [Ganoderma leucocontextum]|nr:hypothetical protein LXA43DRAFT_1097070 [Ganoderma leucocontextum]